MRAAMARWNSQVQLGAKIDWDWIDREIAPLYNDRGRHGIASRFADEAYSIVVHMQLSDQK
jgi:hypothetical protein